MMSNSRGSVELPNTANRSSFNQEAATQKKFEDFHGVVQVTNIYASAEKTICERIHRYKITEKTMTAKETLVANSLPQVPTADISDI